MFGALLFTTLLALGLAGEALHRRLQAARARD
jgi:hypothetical protein